MLCKLDQWHNYGKLIGFRFDDAFFVISYSYLVQHFFLFCDLLSSFSVSINADEYGSFHNSTPPFHYYRSRFSCIHQNKKMLWDSLTVEVHPGMAHGCGISLLNSEVSNQVTGIAVWWVAGCLMNVWLLDGIFFWNLSVWKLRLKCWNIRWAVQAFEDFDTCLQKVIRLS